MGQVFRRGKLVAAVDPEDIAISGHPHQVAGIGTVGVREVDAGFGQRTGHPWGNIGLGLVD